MKKPRPLTEKDQALIQRYSNCQIAMTPQQFDGKWLVTYEVIACICSRSDATVQRWFARGDNYRSPMPIDLYHLAIMDFLLENFEAMPEKLKNFLCPPD